MTSIRSLDAIIAHWKYTIGWLTLNLFSITALLIYASWRRKREIKAIKEQNSCQEPAQYPHQDAWGSDLVKERMNAMKAGKYFKLYETQFATYGKTFEEKVRGLRTINTIEPANVQQILALSFEDYGKDPLRVKAAFPFLGPSIFSDGALWKQSRTRVKPIFARAELSDIDHLASFADRFLELFPDDGSMIDVQPLLHRLFLDVSTDFLFGKPMDALQPEMPTECTEFLAAFAQSQRWVTKRRESGWLSFRYDFNKDWRSSYKKVHRFVDEQVARALEATKPDNKPDTDSSTTRQRYILLHELAKQTRDPIELRYQIMGVFMPARDTTSIAVGNAIFQLARHPHIWTLLRQSSLELGDDQTSLTFEKLKSLTLFRHVVHETIRLIGPAARVVRVATRNTVLPVGGGLDQKSPVFVAEGTTISMGMWCMNHDPDIWGDNVQEFKPERWIGRKTYWDFVPFSGGPRICPAQQQVLTHVVYILVRLTQRFERIENRDPVWEYIEKFNMGFESRNGVKVAFKTGS